ncbi:MAG: hypothetical protein JJU37_05680 [Balneolaceae bacterium]|nr:hypothetical protein [Balneolaceae bacterium]
MSRIPDFDHNHVLPPHLGNPTDKSHLSPYECSILELCHKFSTSKERINILKGLVRFRLKLNDFNIQYGFQWIDGSFIENIEISESRSPRDIDVVTFFAGLNDSDQSSIISSFPEFMHPELCKKSFSVDHYPVDYSFKPDFTVEATRYWLQLFTHSRTNIWKGILRLPLNTSVEDQHAIEFLNSL